jgi:hypothetical protein
MTCQCLPNGRRSENSGFACSGLTYIAAVSRHADGPVGEVFLNNHKIGGHADTTARDAAVVASIALQHRIIIENLRRTLMRDVQWPLGDDVDLITAEQDYEKY